MDDWKTKFNYGVKVSVKTTKLFLKWGIFSITIGLVVGSIGTAFGKAMHWATSTRIAHENLLFFLPISGIFIVFLYWLLKDKNSGTNIIISAIHSGDSIPIQMAPLIFISTIITHLFGGSAGREGAALQLGGSIGTQLGHWLKLNELDQKIVIMCGMSASFSALFGTPMAATIFSMEVVSVGVLYYSALVPCVCSAFIGAGVAKYFGLIPESFPLTVIPEFTVSTAIRLVFLAVGCAIISIIFCILLHTSEYLYKKYFKNAYIRIFIGGILVVLFSLLIGTRAYNGAGIEVIATAIQTGTAPKGAFLFKMIITALTLGAGFKGGEIVPSFFVGATFGCAISSLIGLPPELCSAVGMTAVFCGATNCPITSLLISFELFGYDGMPYYAIAIALSYTLSGYFGLYHSQKIIYSKYRPVYVNKRSI
ncbi:MAG: chloride channel protein [Clostridiales bacterium]|nr:chloride channel protein [Clostridiales bacterium]